GVFRFGDAGNLGGELLAVQGGELDGRGVALVDERHVAVGDLDDDPVEIGPLHVEQGDVPGAAGGGVNVGGGEEVAAGNDAVEGGNDGGVLDEDARLVQVGLGDADLGHGLADVGLGLRDLGRAGRHL